MLFTNRTESYNRAYAYGEYKMRNASERLTFGIVEAADAGQSCHKVELWAHIGGAARRVGVEAIPAWFNEPGTLG